MFTASTPEFPVMDATGNMYGSDSPFRILQISARPWHRTLCNGGFRQLQTLGIKKLIVRALLDLSEFAQAVQLHLPKQYDAVAMDLMGDIRNVVQHRLLSLPKPSDPLLEEEIFEKNNDGHQRVEEDEQEEEEGMAMARTITMEVYRACWLAAFLFSTHVTFPIPATRPVRENLVPQLQDKIRRSSDSLTDEDENQDECNAKSEILLWCTMIGGIAAQDGEVERRCWYAGQLRKLCHTLNIQSWAKMQELMRSFAWVDVACDEGGYRLWMEAFPPSVNSRSHLRIIDVI
jgi:hypothetical protein